MSKKKFMLRLIYVFLLILLSILFFQCCDSHSQPTNFKAVTSPMLSCKSISDDLANVINFMQEKGANIKWERDKWNGSRIDMTDSTFFNTWVHSMRDCKEMKSKLKYIDSSNPVLAILLIMNSKYFFVNNVSRNNQIVEFYLNDKKIIGKFNENNISQTNVSKHKRNDPETKYNIIKNIDKEMKDLKLKGSKNSEAMKDLQLKNIETRDDFKLVYTTMALFFILVIIFFIINILIIIAFKKIAKKEEYSRLRLYDKKVKEITSSLNAQVNNKLDDFYNRLEILEGKKDSSSLTSSPTKKESSVSQSNHLSSYKNNEITDEFINEYHKTLSEGLEDTFIQKWKPKFLKIDNINDRKSQSDIQPHLKNIEDQLNADFWGIKLNDKNILVPGSKLYKNISALTSGGGSGAYAWFKGIFDFEKSDRYEIRKLAYYKEWQIEKGLLTLPIYTKHSLKHSQAKKETSEEKFGLGRDEN